MRLARLLRCAHRDCGSLPGPDAGWAALTRAACRHWVGGILLDAADRQGWRIPASSRRMLEQQTDRIRQDGERMAGALVTVTAALNARGVDVLLLKGCALHPPVYERKGLRAMSDLDIMVRERQVVEAAGALEMLGCRRGPELLRADFFPRYYYATEYRTSEIDPVRIDLHVRPFRPLRYAQTVPADALWENARQVEYDGAVARVPSNEMQLVHLATHLACHDGMRLVWLYDILRLVDRCRASIGWYRVLDRCRAWGLALPVRVALDWVAQVWGPVIPSRVHDTLWRERVDWRGRLCLLQAPRDAKHPIAHAAVDLLCTNGVRFRGGYLRSVLLPDRAHLAQIYHRRHVGWPVVATLRRMIQAGARAVR
jgi:hypothetical protein